MGFAAAFLSMAVLAWFAATEWPGSPHHCAVVYRDALPTDRDVLPHECFCENFDRGALRGHNDGIRQAANTLSNLFPFATGLWLALITGRDRIADALTPPRRDSPWGGHYPMILMLVLGFMAPGSMVFHASLTEWGGWVDNLSMLFFVYFLLAYGLVVRYSREDHQGRYGLFNAVFWLGVLASMGLLIGTPLYRMGWGVLLLWPGVVFVLVEGYQALKHKQGYGGFWAAVVAQGLAFAVWGQARFLGDPLCRGQRDLFGPDSWLQAHALWHVLSNVAALCVFFHFRQSSRDWEQADR